VGAGTFGVATDRLDWLWGKVAKSGMLCGVGIRYGIINAHEKQ
jgi:hypothetical protein